MTRPAMTTTAPSAKPPPADAEPSERAPAPPGGGPPSRPEHRAGCTTRATGRRRAVRTALPIVVLGVAIYLLVPRLAGLGGTLDTLVRLRWWLLPVLITLEAASLALYAELVRTVLAVEGVDAPRKVVRTAVLVGAALGKVLPGGTVAAVPAGVGILRRQGIHRAVAATGLLASGVISSLVLVLLLPVASAAAVLAGQDGAAALGISGVALTVFALACLAWVGIRNPDLGARLAGLLRRLVRAPRYRTRLHVDDLASGIERGASALQAVARDLRGTAIATALAGAGWICDFLVMVTLAVAATRGAPLAGIALGYIVGQLAAAVPLTPGGVGVVETAMVGALVAQGIPAGQATAVVLGWRLISHWLAIVAGLVTYAVVRPGGGEPELADGA
jgi:uncharacterized protein (TIRG00374 family)